MAIESVTLDKRPARLHSGEIWRAPVSEREVQSFVGYHHHSREPSSHFLTKFQFPFQRTILINFDLCMTCGSTARTSVTMLSVWPELWPTKWVAQTVSGWASICCSWCSNSKKYEVTREHRSIWTLKYSTGVWHRLTCFPFLRHLKSECRVPVMLSIPAVDVLNGFVNLRASTNQCCRHGSLGLGTREHYDTFMILEALNSKSFEARAKGFSMV